MNKTHFSAAIVAAISLLGSASLAQAGGIPQNVTVLNGAGGTLANNVNLFDWNAAGSGVAKGAAPAGGPLVVGQQIPFLYQANLVTFNGSNGGNLSPGCLGTTCEWTIVANATEIVRADSSLPNQANFDFAPGGKVSIFYDTTPNANYATGTGFDDGVEIARFSIASGTANFNAPLNLGSTNVQSDILATPDFYNPAYIQGITAAIFDLEFQSTQQIPTAGTLVSTNYHIGGSATYSDYVATASDLLFRVDGSSSFSYTTPPPSVPEPGSLLLIGTGLLGFGIARRRFHRTAGM